MDQNGTDDQVRGAAWLALNSVHFEIDGHHFVVTRLSYDELGRPCYLEAVDRDTALTLAAIQAQIEQRKQEGTWPSTAND